MTDIQEFRMTPYDGDVYVLKCDHIKAMENSKAHQKQLETGLDKAVKKVESQAKEIERYKKFLVLAAEFVSLCETKEKDKEKAIALIKQAEEFIK